MLGDEYGPEKTEVFVWRDIWFSMILKWKPKKDSEGDRECYHADFELYEISGFGEDVNKRFEVPFYKNKGATDSMDQQLDITKAEMLVDGYLKWDGCCEFTFNGQNHFCGMRNFAQLHEAIKLVYKTCAEKFGFEED